jgi:hypothetical protein
VVAAALADTVPAAPDATPWRHEEPVDG